MMLPHFEKMSFNAFCGDLPRLERKGTLRSARRVTEGLRTTRAIAGPNDGWHWIVGLKKQGSRVVAEPNDFGIRSLLLPVYESFGEWDIRFSMWETSTRLLGGHLHYEKSDVATKVRIGTAKERQTALESFVKFDAYYLVTYQNAIAIPLCSDERTEPLN